MNKRLVEIYLDNVNDVILDIDDDELTLSLRINDEYTTVPITREKLTQLVNALNDVEDEL